MALRQSNISSTAGSASPNCSYSSLPLSGSALIVGIASWKGSAHTHNSVADNKGNTWTQVGTTQAFAAGGGQVRLSKWRLDNVPSATGTFTVTLTASATCDARMAIAEESGAQASALDQVVSGSGTGTSASVTLPTTTNAYDVLYGVLTTGQDATAVMTEDGSFSVVREDQDNASNQAISLIRKEVTSTGTYAVSWTIGSAAWGAAAVALKLTAAATALLPRRQPLRVWPRVARW